MSTVNGVANRKSYLLSVTPVDFSLTAGTNIPAPPLSPAGSTSSARPPTSGGGPLTSHPTTPEDHNRQFFSAPEADKENESRAAPSMSGSGNVAKGSGNGAFRTPMSPASTSTSQPASSPEPYARPSGVRKLLSLTNLRSSFSSSRTSLALPRSGDDQQTPPNYRKRPSSPGGASATTTASSYQSPVQQRSQLGQKRSRNWFKRKSNLFMMSSDGLAKVDEDQRPDTRESKRLKEASPAPHLPELASLGGGGLSGGTIDWDEQFFKK